MSCQSGAALSTKVSPSLQINDKVDGPATNLSLSSQCAIYPTYISNLFALAT